MPKIRACYQNPNVPAKIGEALSYLNLFGVAKVLQSRRAGRKGSQQWSGGKSDSTAIMMSILHAIAANMSIPFTRLATSVMTASSPSRTVDVAIRLLSLSLPFTILQY